MRRSRTRRGRSLGNRVWSVLFIYGKGTVFVHKITNSNRLNSEVQCYHIYIYVPLVLATPRYKEKARESSTIER